MINLENIQTIEEYKEAIEQAFKIRNEQLLKVDKVDG